MTDLSHIPQKVIQKIETRAMQIQLTTVCILADTQDMTLEKLKRLLKTMKTNLDKMEK